MNNLSDMSQWNILGKIMNYTFKNVVHINVQELT